MTKQSKPVSGSEIFVPLNKLKKSPNNVRKVPHTVADIEGLAASIAANGLLQNLIVEPECDDGRDTGFYLVTIGEGRRLAYLLRAKRKQIKKTEPIRCTLDTEHDAQEISLAENVIRSAMHPADEYEAFASLHNDKGMAAEDIAARFGVTPAVVRQRLKLGAVSPVLLGLYREGEMTLEQVMAFTLTDDHARQQEVWDGLGYDTSAYTIRRALTEGQVAVSDRRAKFVGVEDYVEAGGVITRDLFDDAHGGYLADAALLDRLVLAKLEREAESVRGEGWAWVMVAPEFDHRATGDMRRVYCTSAPISRKAESEITALELEHIALVDNLENEVASDETPERLAEIEARLEELQGAPVFDPADIAAGGAFVSLGYDGAARVERGFIRKVDETPLKAAVGQTEAETACDKRGTLNALPEKLVAELTAYRTAALREAVANRPDVAFVAVVHALVVQTFYRGGTVSCLDIAARSAFLSRHAPGIDESPLGRAGNDRQAALGAALPDDAQDLWAMLQALPQNELMRLLAHCAALTITAVMETAKSPSHPLKHADRLAEAVSLDMSQHWQPTAANYLGRVKKAAIGEAVREAVSPQAADNIVQMKKDAMAAAAERLLMGKGWLPPLLRLLQSNDRV